MISLRQKKWGGRKRVSFVAGAAIRSPAPGEAERWMLVPDAEHCGKTDIVEPVSRGMELM